MKIFTLERREKQKTFKDEKKSLIFFVRSVYVCVMRSSQLTFCSTVGCGFLQPNPKIGICRNIFRLPVRMEAETWELRTIFEWNLFLSRFGRNIIILLMLTFRSFFIGNPSSHLREKRIIHECFAAFINVYFSLGFFFFFPLPTGK